VCSPLTMYFSVAASICVCAPSSHPKNLVGSTTREEGYPQKIAYIMKRLRDG
jgi:hypothetical protein